jgi:hypothetical protein
VLSSQAMFLLLLPIGQAGDGKAREGEVWAGHAIVTGKRTVPVLGKVEAKTESFVIAKVERTARGLRLEQTSCEIALSNPLGVKLSLNPDAAPKLPPVILDFVLRDDGRYYEGPSTQGWDKEDVDGDGSPGMTVNVSAPVCGGKLFVGIETTGSSRGTLFPDGTMRGEMRAKIKQTVLGTEGACLAKLAGDAEEPARGVFAYVPVEADATCATLAKGRWPIRAKD